MARDDQRLPYIATIERQRQGALAPDDVASATIARALIGPDGTVRLRANAAGVLEGAFSPSNMSKVLWVDATGGSDSDRVKPYQTLSAAKAAANSGDLILVLPGTYNEKNILKNGVNWHFFPGTIIQPTTSYVSQGREIFDDLDGAVTSSITGALECVVGTNASGGMLNLSNASSVVRIQMRRLSGSPSGNAKATAMAVSNGQAEVVLDDATCSGGNLTWWQNGHFYLRANRLVLSGGSGAAVWAECSVDQVPTGDFWVDCPHIGYAGGAGCYIYGNASINTHVSEYRVWVKTSEIFNQLGFVQFNGVLTYGIKSYVQAEKIMGKISVGTAADGGEAWITTQKQQGISTITGGTLHLNGLQFDDTSISAGTDMITVNHANSVLHLRNGYMKRTVTGHGLNVSAGTARITGMTIDTSVSNANSPINKSGGTLSVDGCVLVAEGTRDSIAAGTAQNVKIYGTSVTNRAKNANVTLQVNTSGLLVDTNVA